MRTPRQIVKARRFLSSKWRKLKKLKQCLDRNSDIVASASAEYKNAKLLYRKAVRQYQVDLSIRRDLDFFKNPKATFAKISRAKRTETSKINSLKVGPVTYTGDHVPDGFFESISQLKTKGSKKNEASNYFNEFLEEYHHIIKLSEHSPPLDSITEGRALDLLTRLKPNVCDFFSITPNHFLYAGPAGVRHFSVMLNMLLHDIQNVAISEVNRAYACVLFKGHSKDRTQASSYRTISFCPLVAKALDLHIRDLHIKEWNADQSATQFQGEDSSHELAALLLSECIDFSKTTLKSPVYVLYLDDRSAFDLVQRELLIRNLFHIQSTTQSLLYIDHRLAKRETVVDFDGNLMGPIHDQQGLEQGGISSSDFYKIFGKMQLTLAQDSSMGVPLGKLTIGAIGQADDTVLLSNDLVCLSYLLELTEVFCQKALVELCAEKTTLQAFYPRRYDPLQISIDEVTNPIKIKGKPITFSASAEHVGVVRHTDGNGPAILARCTAHRKALGAVLHQGLAKGHRANPTFSLKAHCLYATPVLFSGLGALILTNKEIDMIENHYRDCLRSLLRLLKGTPRGIIYFLAGSLPGTALLHLKQLSLFGMITRKDGCVLNQHAINIFSCQTIPRTSWFYKIRDLCILYNLPHPSCMLASPMTKSQFKKFTKSGVISYWETLLREEVSCIRSAPFFNAQFMSLRRIHPLFSSAGHSPAHVTRSLVQSIMLSGRYRCGALTRYWNNNDGSCMLSVICKGILEDIPHILKFCPALVITRNNLLEFTHRYLTELPDELKFLLGSMYHPDHPQFCQLLLDCSSIPSIISLTQQLGPFILEHIFFVSRVWVFALHRERLKLLGKWKHSI